MDSNPPPALVPRFFPVFVIVLALGAVIYWALQVLPVTQNNQVPMTGPGSIVVMVRQDLRAGITLTLTQAGDVITLQARGNTYRSTFDNRLHIVAFLRHAGIDTGSQRFRTDVTVRYASPSVRNNLLATVLSLLPLLIFAGLLLYFTRRRRGGTG